jgi:hypothetical protein
VPLLAAGALVVMDVHARDVVSALVAKSVDTDTDFEWQAQLRRWGLCTCAKLIIPACFTSCLNVQLAQVFLRLLSFAASSLQCMCNIYVWQQHMHQPSSTKVPACPSRGVSLFHVEHLS